MSGHVQEAISPDGFAEHLAAQGYRSETIRTYRRHVTDWIAYAHQRRFDVLGPPLDEVAWYINVRHAKNPDGLRILKPSAGLRRTRRQALAAYGIYLRYIGLSQGYPTSLVRLERAKVREVASARTLRPDEIAAVLEASRGFGMGAYTVMRLLCDLGPRAHEMAKARRRSWVPWNAPPLLQLGDEGRGSLSRREVDPSTASALSEYLQWLDAVMPRVDRSREAPLLLLPVRQWDTPIPLTERRLERLVLKVVRASGVDPEGVCPRAFRCAWIRQALAAFPLAEVSRAIGHRHITSTLRYCPAGTVPVFGAAAQVREVCGGSVTRGVLLMRALDGGEEQPALMELWRRKEKVARLQTESRLLRDLEGTQAHIEALEREIADLRARVGAA
ncbi:tyrosine-type recombinase/integrase [Streptomyces sp. NPDC001709]